MNKLILLILLLGMGVSNNLAAQSFEIKVTGAQTNNQIPLKAYKVESRQEHPYTFTADSKYVISVENTQKTSVIVKLLDGRKQELVSNYMPARKKLYQSIAFDCPRSGMYYIVVEPVETASLQ